MHAYLLDLLLVHGDLRRAQGGHGHKVQVRLATQLSRQPQERLLEVVVALGADVVVLQVLLAVECDVLSLDLAILDVNLPGSESNEARDGQVEHALLPHSTIGMFSHTRTRSRCQVGTFLYVTRAVTSNMMMAHCIGGSVTRSTHK